MGAGVTHLLTTVDLDDRDDAGPDARRMAVRARHEAVLSDGRRVLLLDDRGWGGTMGVGYPDGPPTAAQRRRDERDAPGIWAYATVDDMEETARMVVGPDEPWNGTTREEEEAAHWEWMSQILREHGIEATSTALREVRHDVALSDRVLARIGHGAIEPGRD